jgi:RHS repeat-associated protein
MDRLGSVVKSGADTLSYWPYGEQKSGPVGNDKEKFAPYWREEGTGLDYVRHRFYSPTFGRFLTAEVCTILLRLPRVIYPRKTVW